MPRNLAEILAIPNQLYACGFSVTAVWFWILNNPLSSWSELLGSIDFVEKGSEAVVFRTCDQEKDKVVFQIGTSDAARALTAAQLL